MAARRFYKMSGSGNDFVIFDAREEPVGSVGEAGVIQALCARGTGVGADGVVFIERPSVDVAHIRMRYYNSDGSRAAMCGNAALCVTRLAAELGAAPAEEMRIESDSGILSARVAAGSPEVELQTVSVVQRDADVPLAEGERRIGFAIAGVPHLVVLCDDVDAVDVVGRGRPLRRHRSLRHGANVNFVSKREGWTWGIRTYERGVEGETLACGTGAIATAVLLSVWGVSGTETTLATRSGRLVTVRLRESGGDWLPTLRGEGKLVYTGELADA
jgi:diaminopimelate epimerase